MLGIHTNIPATVPAAISQALTTAAAPPANLNADERNAWDQFDFFNKNGLGYG